METVENQWIQEEKKQGCKIPKEKEGKNKVDKEKEERKKYYGPGHKWARTEYLQRIACK